MAALFNKTYKNKGIKAALVLVIIFILVDTTLTYQYRQALYHNIEVQQTLDEIAAQKTTIISNLNNIDMSLRGYLLVQNEAFLGTYDKIKRASAPSMKFLHENLPAIGIPASRLSKMNTMLDNYFDLMDNVVSLSKSGSMDEALAILKEDHGTAVWQTYMDLSAVIDPVVKEKKQASQDAYNRLLTMSLLFQAIVFLVGVPTLIYTIISLLRTERRRTKLFQDLDIQNRTLIFDSNKKIDIQDESQVIGELINNLSKASEFIKRIGQGDFTVMWEGYKGADVAVNEHAIAGELIAMREEMKKKQEEGARQQWVSEGLNKLTDIIREHQSDFRTLSEKSVFFVIKYLKAQQGGLFVMNEDDKDDRYLSLVTCYAFDRKKFITKRVEIGEGIIGQTFLEGEPVYMRDVPSNYITITSGLGEANPNRLTVQPLKHNEEVVALLEIASFTEFDTYAMAFLSSGCKALAAAIMSLQSSQKTKLLLEQSQQQAEEMRAQEEEMRQNMEELEATQEEMKRRESDLR